MILFPINSPDTAALQTSFLKPVSATSSPVFVAVSNNLLPYLLDRFLENDKNQYPLTYSLILGSVE